jgi:hypothetical protein
MTSDHSAPGRRAAAPRRFRGDPASLAATAALVLAVVAVLLTGSARGVEEERGLTAGSLVTHTLLACPDLPPPRRGSAGLEVGSVPGVELGTGGTLTRRAPGKEATALAVRRGRLLRLDDTSRPVVEADGAIAAGLFGFRTDRSPRALAVAPCQAPRARWWFTGAGATLDHSSELVLSNVDPGPAVVDVRLLGPHGEVPTVGTRGITIAPGAQRLIPMSDIAPQTDQMTIGVRASRGRVVAGVRDSFAVQGAVGQEWLPAAERPSRSARLAGLPAGPGSRTLLVANPSSLEAVVRVQVVGRSGPFTAAGLDELRVAPGTTEEVDIGAALNRAGPVALRLRSQVPVLATVRSTAAGDTSYAASVVPLVGAAAAPVVDRFPATLEVTAGGLSGQVSVVGYDAEGMRVGGTRLDLPPRSTLTWRPGRRAAFLVVTPRRGAVYGAVSYRGAGLSQAALTTLPVRLRQPVVRPALR